MSEKHGNSKTYPVCLFREASREARRVMIVEEEEKYQRSEQAGKAARSAQERWHREWSWLWRSRGCASEHKGEQHRGTGRSKTDRRWIGWVSCGLKAKATKGQGQIHTALQLAVVIYGGLACSPGRCPASRGSRGVFREGTEGVLNSQTNGEIWDFLVICTVYQAILISNI